MPPALASIFFVLHQFFSNLHFASVLYLLHATQLSSSISSSSHAPSSVPHSFRHSYFPSPSNIAPHVLASISMPLPTAFTFQYPSHPPAHPISISIYPTLPLLVLHPIRLPSSTRPPFSLPHNLTSSADPGSSGRGSPVPRSRCPLRLAITTAVAVSPPQCYGATPPWRLLRLRTSAALALARSPGH